jgi:hypothetical protein
MGCSDGGIGVVVIIKERRALFGSMAHPGHLPHFASPMHPQNFRSARIAPDNAESWQPHQSGPQQARFQSFRDLD